VTVIGERRLQALVDAMDDAVTVRDAEGRIMLANPAALALLGVGSLEELREIGLAGLYERYALTTADGQPFRDEPSGEPVLLRRIDRRTGEQRWLLTRASPLTEDNGASLILNVTQDVTAVRRAELGQRLLVEAGRRLSETVDLEATLQDIADLTVPALADWCTIDTPGPGGWLRQVAVAHVDPAKVAIAHRLRARHPLHIDDERAPASVLRTGTARRIDAITPAMVREDARDEQHLELLEALGLCALLVVPLWSGDAVLGTLSLVSSQPHRRFDDADEDVAAALARRIGDALRNYRLIRDRTEIAHVLSAGLRPDPAPILPGCEVAAVYRPAGEDVEAGGDFYDVIDAPSGSIVVIGDVVGKGAPAAALSAVSRVTLRTAGRLTGDPHAALDELNHALRRRGGMSLCTVAAVALPSELPGRARLLLAGHPPPLLVREERVTPLGRPGPLLGAVEVADWPETEVELLPGDVLVLYTDGALDAVLPGGERFGEARLRAIAEQAGDDVDAFATAFAERLGDLRLRDDVALLAIRCPGPPPLLLRGTLEGEAEPLLALSLPGGRLAPRAARAALGTALGTRAGERLAGDALIVLSELVTNAIRHGGARTPDDQVLVHAALLPGALRLEVTDPGPGFEPGGHGPRADGGYGLHLLDRVASRWGVTGAEPVTVWVELES
jgi:PAS domain S-box-containing protein